MDDYDEISDDSCDVERDADAHKLLNHLEHALAPLVRLPWRAGPPKYAGQSSATAAAAAFSAAKMELLGFKTAAHRMPRTCSGKTSLQRCIMLLENDLMAAESAFVAQQASSKHEHGLREECALDASCVLNHAPVLSLVLRFCGLAQWAYIARVNRAFHGVYMYVLASMPHGIYELFLTSERTAVYSKALIDYAVANRLPNPPNSQFRRELGRTGSLQLISYAAEKVPGMSVHAEVLIGLVAKLDLPLLRQVQAEFNLPDLNQALGVNDWCTAGLEAAAAGDDGRMLTWIAQQIRALPARRMHRCYSGKYSPRVPLQLHTKPESQGMHLQWLMDEGVSKFGPAQQYLRADVNPDDVWTSQYFTGDLCADFSSERWRAIASPLDAAACGGHRHIIDWLRLEQSHAFTKHTLPLAIEGGNRVALLEWLVAEGCPCCRSRVKFSASCERKAVRQWAKGMWR
ncbi:hypothetical protein JKP88DRAFT_249597 [Tribonema minus]|uniref:Uncharacterized protein n=1 Tax=Tribonema minus TaxID=303371 RepID=A0A835YJ91_9STRA|nr:hypothetical protein JKP88DRAFT_249597 [Tribonema minus]